LWAIAYPSSSNQSYRAVFAALAAGLDVGRLTHPFGPEGQQLPVGSFVILAGSAPHDALRSVVRQTQLPPTVLTEEIAVARQPIRNPRVALVETYFHDMDAGWTRYLFDT
jgi:hypothetical protein